MIIVTRPRMLSIPTELTNFMNSLIPDIDLRHENSPGVDYQKYKNEDFFVANSIVEYHTDLEHPQYSALLVLVNQPNSYVEVKGIDPITHQPPGTLILLDTYMEHRLWNELGNEAPNAIWACLPIEYTTKPTLDTVIDDMIVKLRKVGR